MQELNYNYRSDVTYIATFELKLRAFQWKVTLFFIQIFEYNYWYVHVYDQQYVLFQRKKILILFQRLHCKDLGKLSFKD